MCFATEDGDLFVQKQQRVVVGDPGIQTLKDIKMADITDADLQRLQTLYYHNLRLHSSTSSATSSESIIVENEVWTNLDRKQSTPAYLPSISVTSDERLIALRARARSFNPHRTRSLHGSTRRHSSARHSGSTLKSTSTARNDDLNSERGSSTSGGSHVSLTELPPEFRSRADSLPVYSPSDEPEGTSDIDDDHYLCRRFDISSRGKIHNQGDAIQVRSRSPSLGAELDEPSDGSISSQSDKRFLSVSSAQSSHTSRSEDIIEEEVFDPNVKTYRVHVYGCGGVGKTSLITQFLSSDEINVFEAPTQEGNEQAVSVLLDGEESCLNFVDNPSETKVMSADAYLLLYSIADRSTFETIVDQLYELKQLDDTHDKVIILVGNKTDLARARAVEVKEGIAIATSYDCKFVETSVSLCHHVDELLVGTLKQIRLRQEQEEPSNRAGKKITKKKKYARYVRKSSIVQGYDKALAFLSRLRSKDSPVTRSCGNLHIL